ncbi:MAG: hypothetical protein KDC87_15825 [Planctomycetes bacterium]|nr:hypothetical protein [Planctomycetota bacterium]
MRIHPPVLLLLAASPLCAQAQWTQLNPSSAPSKRANSHLASDAVSAYVFAGNLNATTFYNDLWRFLGTTWTNVSLDGAAGAPPKRRWGSMTFDYGRGQLLVFGGQDSSNANLSDTWTWNGSAWTQHTPAVAPSARRWATMSYDWTSGKVILFGGYDGTTSLGDTWSWDGTAWNKLAPANSPPARGRCSMASKRDAKELILFGGTSGTSSPALGDMWLWNGTNWSTITTTNAPYTTGVLTAPMYWDELRERLVVFGGYNGFERGDTYEFHNGTWTLRTFTNQPVARSRPGMAYISALNKAIMFGGYGGPTVLQLGDTWEYQTSAVAAVSTSGTGCAGSGGVPGIQNSNLPWIDDTFSITLTNIGSANPMLVIGFSKTTWSGGTLPFNLGIIGYSACDLRVSMNLMVGGLTSLNLPIPNDNTLIGQEVYFQAASLGPGNSLGVSGRTDIKFGAR